MGHKYDHCSKTACCVTNLRECINHAALWFVCRLQIHQDLREDLAKVKTLDGLADVSKQLKQRCQVMAASQNSGANVQVLSYIHMGDFFVCTSKVTVHFKWLDGHWINTMYLSLQRTLGICGGEHSRSGLSYDAQMISQKADSVLIDSYFKIFTIAWALGAQSWWKNKVFLNLNWQNRHKPVSEVLYLKSSSWLALLIFLCWLLFKDVPIIYLYIKFWKAKESNISSLDILWILCSLANIRLQTSCFLSCFEPWQYFKADFKYIVV